MEKLLKVKINEQIDLDNIAIEKDDSLPMAFVFILPLNSKPSKHWKKFFKEEWKSSLYPSKREVKIMDDSLRITTTPDEIEGKIDWINGIIESTNNRIDKHNKELRKKKEIEEIRKKKEEEMIKRIRKQLKKQLIKQ